MVMIIIFIIIIIIINYKLRYFPVFLKHRVYRGTDLFL